MYTPESIAKERFSRFQKKMQETGLSMVLITKPVNFFHFSLFTPRIYSMPSCVIIPAEGIPTILVQAVRGPKAKREVPYGQVLCYGTWSDNPSVAPDLFDAIYAIIQNYCVEKLTLGADLAALSVDSYFSLRKKLELDAISDITPIIRSDRIIKDALALDRIRMAANLCVHSINTQIASLREGATERAACTNAMTAVMHMAEEKYPDIEMSGFGTDEESIIYSFSFSCSSGVRSSYGSTQAISQRPREGDFVLPCTTVRMGGYAAECERSLYCGSLTPEREKIFKTVLEARQKVFETVKPGNTFADLYRAAQTVFQKNGQAEYMAGRIGHGIGLGNHEMPSVDAASEQPLEPGMVFTVEPSIMSACFGGVRPSDTVVVTKDGYELLTPAENGFLRMA